MHSFELLTRVSANPLWADRCEELAFNSLPAALTPNLKALHYLTCANQVQLDRSNKAPGIQNSGTMFSYSPLVKISEKTDYPFSETISFQISVDHPVSFPLYLRVPQWCENPSLQINGRPVPLKGRPATYLAVSCTWQKGDIATLQLPMKTAVRKWPKNNNAVSVHYGPLAFSLKIKERWSRYGGTDLWPESEVFPDSPWNYGLVLPDQNPEAALRVVRRAGSVLAQPFTLESAPLELRAQARKIPNWK